MTCKLCDRASYGDTCGYCVNIISLELERFHKARHLGLLALFSAFDHQAATFEDRVAIKGPEGKIVSWDTIDKLTKGRMRNA